jgi:hypothetical protein
VSGAQPNDGFLLRTAAKKHTLIVSSEGQTVSLRPSLSVTYTTPDDHCAPNPCRNGGSCANDAQGYTCSCPAGYSGVNCESLVDRCASHPCQNGGACSSGASSFTCACADGFSGANCQTNVNDCAPNPCQNGGICTDGTNSHTCACPAGYTGANCETLIDSCASSPCQNAGVCTNGIGTYSCGCAPGFTGISCEINIDDCAAQPCQNGGSCSDGVASFTCSCAPGFSGSTCQTLIDNCASGPCQNGGVCTNGVNRYTCGCAAGFTGINCEIDVNDCAPNPCQNGGLCVDRVNAFTCQCPSPYSGTTCQTVPSDPCLAAGGTLVPLSGNYTLTDAASLTALVCVNEITGTLTISTDVSVPTIALPSLKKVGGLIVKAAAHTSTVDLRQLTAESGELIIEPNTFLTAVDVSGATLGGLLAQDNPNLTSLRLGPFADTVLDVMLVNETVLTDIGPNGVSTAHNIGRDMLIHNTPLTSLGPTGLSNLVSVARNLSILGNTRLTDLGPTSLANLVNVGSIPLNGGALRLQANPLITSVDVSHATLFSLVVIDNPSLTSLRLGTLADTVQDVMLVNEPMLTDLGPNGLSSIHHVARDISIQTTPLTSLGPTGLSNLATVGRNVGIVDNSRLTGLGPTSLANVLNIGSEPFNGGGLTLQLNPLLTSVDVSHATLFSLVVTDDPTLASLRLGSLADTVQDLMLVNVPLLTDLGPNGVSSVHNVSRDLLIRTTPLTSLGPTGLGNLATVGRNVAIIDNARLTGLGPTSLANVLNIGSAPYNGGELTLQLNPLLTSVDVSHAVLFGLWLQDNVSLASLRLGSFADAALDVALINEPVLNDLGPNGLSSVHNVVRDVVIQSTALTSLGPTGLGNLATVGRHLTLVDNAGLTGLGVLSNLTSVGSAPYGGGDLRVIANPHLSTIDAGALTAIAGSLVVDGNLTLATLRLDTLVTLQRNLQITNNPALPGCFTSLLANLVGFTGTVTIAGDAVCP